MSSYCYLCGQFVAIDTDHVNWGLSGPAIDGFEFVCDRCVNKKLNFGEPREGGCLYCENDTDYSLRTYEPSITSSGPIFHTADHNDRPIVCQEHLEEIDESDRENILSIGDTTLGSDRSNPPNVSIPDAIGQEEDRHLEYKETFQYNVVAEQPDKNLKEEVVEEVVAFANTEGGVVIIGVRDDDKEITGLQRDYESMGVGWDSFSLQVGDMISNINNDFAASCTSVEQHNSDGSDICVIRVSPSPDAVFTGDDEFYVRQDSSSVPLSGEEMVRYITNNF